MDKILRPIKKFIPKKVFTFFQPVYHYLLALLGAIIYRFPSRKIKVVAVTGTKGKTSTVEFVNAILEEAGFITALASTLRFKIRDISKPNMLKMTMPGRFFTQKFLRQAVDAHCDYAVVEISSEAAKQYRHKFIDLDALIFTNIAPEHIESHGSFEKYLEAKLKIAKALESSPKKGKIIVANIDDKEGHKFLNINVEKKAPYSLKDGEPIVCHDDGVKFVCEEMEIESKLLGKFNVYNMLAATSYARALGISLETIKAGLEKVTEIKGRAQKIPNNLGIEVIVDYAHTPDSLKAIYETFPNKKKICVLGNCGGGRDKWKRKEMSAIADNYCDEIIVTDEDPYDDDPLEIAEQMAGEIKNKKPKLIIDRRVAISEAIRLAKLAQADQNVVVLITGKGTDPYIMRANGQKEPWSDARVAEEEIAKIK
ncbi:MAG: UDP-N-acetylmuramyl-tripeptide synthetase [Candidatus Paceibacterota bacterium]